MATVSAPSLADYVKGESIGRGSYGVVYKGMHLASGDIVALKKISHLDDGVTTSAVREVAILFQLEHPNIIRCVMLTSAYFEQCERKATGHGPIPWSGQRPPRQNRDTPKRSYLKIPSVCVQKQSARPCARGCCDTGCAPCFSLEKTNCTWCLSTSSWTCGGTWTAALGRWAQH